MLPGKERKYFIIQSANYKVYVAIRQESQLLLTTFVSTFVSNIPTNAYRDVKTVKKSLFKHLTVSQAVQSFRNHMMVT
jgi:hypothetical protein